MGTITDKLTDMTWDAAYASWALFFQQEMQSSYFCDLDDFITGAYCVSTCFPPEEDIFNAFSLPADQVKVVILGQDPYPTKGMAHGLAFSVREGNGYPPSLRNIAKEYEADTGKPLAGTDLTPWKDKGVFLLNTILTVHEGEPLSHAGHGWEVFTKHALEYLVETRDTKKPLAAILWGSGARSYRPVFQRFESKGGKLLIIESAHPSPLSAYRGFFGSRPFSQVNQFLKDHGN